MITFLTLFISSILLFFSVNWLSDLVTLNNIAEVGVAALAVIATTASVQLRRLYEKAQNILLLYAQYSDPKSEGGSKLSATERERLLDLFLHELRIVIDQFGGRILIRVGGFIRKVFNKLFG